MQKLFALLALSLSLAVAEPLEYSDTPEVKQKVLYLSYASLPERIYKGQIFSVTYKTLSTDPHFQDIAYRFEGGKGCKLLHEAPERSVQGPYYFDTFHLLSTGTSLRLPDVTASLQYSDFHDDNPTKLQGSTIKNVITLNPGKDFSGLLAESVEVIDYKTTRYSPKYNIAVFTLQARRSDLSAFHLNNAVDQGIESVSSDHNLSTLTYFAILPKALDNLQFTYFDLDTDTFAKLLVPIIVEDDSVSTQSDLKPTEHKHTAVKIAVAGGIAFVGMTLLLFRRKLLYAVMVVVPGVYIGYAAIPIEYVCIKSGVPIYLLPIDRGTVFDTTAKRQTLEVHGRVDGYVKIKLDDNHIGWVKHEDLCIR